VGWPAVAVKKPLTRGSIYEKSHEVRVGVGGAISAIAIRGYGYQSARRASFARSCCIDFHARSWIGEPGRSGGLLTTCKVMVVREVIEAALQSTVTATGDADCAPPELTASAIAPINRLRCFRADLARFCSAHMCIAHAKPISFAGEPIQHHGKHCRGHTQSRYSKRHPAKRIVPLRNAGLQCIG
jgi:hypothetical protein